MKFYGEMRVQGGGPLDGSRFDALAYALAEIEEADPAVEDVDLTASLAQGWVTASMTIVQENLELAVTKLIATVRAAIYPNGDHAGGWQFLTESAGLSVHPATDRSGTSVPNQGTPSASFAMPSPAAPPGCAGTAACPHRPGCRRRCAGASADGHTASPAAPASPAASAGHAIPARRPGVGLALTSSPGRNWDLPGGKGQTALL